VLPRIASVITTSASSSPALEMKLFRTEYIIAAVVFALLIGGSVMIWEWNVRSSPRQTFVAALGLPALFAGALNSAAISGNASRLGEDLQRITDQHREENGIRVETSQNLPAPDNSSFLWQYLERTAFAQGPEVEAKVVAS